MSGEDKGATNQNGNMTDKQLAQKLKREAAKKKREEDAKVRKAEQDAKKESRKLSKNRFSICTKVGQPMAVAYKHAMEQLERAKKKGLQEENSFNEVADIAKILGAWKDQVAKALASYACNPDTEIKPLPFETAKEANDKVKDLLQSVKKLKEIMNPKPKKRDSPEK